MHSLLRYSCHGLSFASNYDSSYILYFIYFTGISFKLLFGHFGKKVTCVTVGLCEHVEHKGFISCVFYSSFAYKLLHPSS